MASTTTSASGLSDARPPYCCIILTDTGDVRTASRAFFEERGSLAAVAANKLTCFGGKRELGEEPAACIVRECFEAMGVPHPAVQIDISGNDSLLPPAPDGAAGWSLPSPEMLHEGRASDLYVDGTLIAWFFHAAGPASAEQEAALRFENGRRGVWASLGGGGGVPADPRLSPWHTAVLSAWQSGQCRADFASPTEAERLSLLKLLASLPTAAENEAKTGI
jgi:8-oxo-dGTP pyrophosphatase MutT (NUDIX family)